MNQENNVSHTNNKKTPENDNIKPTPIDAKDQLTLLQQYQDFVKNANTQIDRVSKIHWTLLIILGLVIAVGIFFTYRTASDFKTEVRNDVEILKKEVEKRIDNELGKEELHKLITAKVSERIAEIADDLIKQHITDNISPKIIELDNKLSEVSLELNKIREDRKKLDELNNFTLTFLKAIGDDYKAFVQLENWSNDSSFAFSEISFRMYQTIRIIHYQQKQISISFIKFPDEIALSKMPFSEFQTFISQQDPIFHADIIKIISERSDIEQIEKTPFLIEVLNKSNSLLARNSSGTLFERAYKDFRWVPFNIDAVNTKWKEIQQTTKQ